MPGSTSRRQGASQASARRGSDYSYTELATLRDLRTKLRKGEPVAADLLSTPVRALVANVIQRELDRQPPTPPHEVCDTCGQDFGDTTKPITGHYPACLLCQMQGRSPRDGDETDQLAMVADAETEIPRSEVQGH